MALERHALAAVGAKHLGMGLEHRPVFVLDDEAVEVEVQHALRQRAAGCSALLGQVDRGHAGLRAAAAAGLAGRPGTGAVGRHVAGLDRRLVQLGAAAAGEQRRPGPAPGGRCQEFACFVASCVSGDGKGQRPKGPQAGSRMSAPVVSRRRLDLAVQRGGHQHVAPLRATGIHQQAAVGRKARALVVAGVGDGGGGAAGQLLHHHLEGAALAGDVGQHAAIGADRRADVVAARESDPLGIAPAHRHAVDLRAAAAVADEVDLPAVGRERRLGVDGRCSG